VVFVMPSSGLLFGFLTSSMLGVDLHKLNPLPVTFCKRRLIYQYKESVVN